jgi:type I restriction enzyme S subunit
MTDLHPYPEYKESGVSWLGRVPSHWEQAHGGAMLKQKQVKNRGMIESTVLSLSYGRIVVKPPEKLHGLVPESFETYQIVDPDDIIIRPTDLQNDWKTIRVGIARNRGIITSAYLCFRTRKPLTAEYAYLLLLGYDLKKIFYGMGSGLRQNLDWSDFKSLPMLLPPPEEQQAIIAYIKLLDRRINHFIRNRRRLIDVLNEQKQAIVNRAVTRGLDPDVPLKPSGNKWMGDIPGHWEVHRLRRLAVVRLSSVDKVVADGEQPVRLCNYVDVYHNDLITENIDFMQGTASDPEIEAFQLQVGDILITKDSEHWEDIAVPAFVPKTLQSVVCGYHLAIIRPRQDIIDGEYLARAFSAESICVQFRVAANGVTRYGLPQEAIKGAFFPVPPLEEQREIVGYIREQLYLIQAVITRARKEIDLIQEYRTGLIADVVTGKVDVRHLESDTLETPSVTVRKPADSGRIANVYFRRAVFAAEIVHRLYKEPTFGHIKFQKLIHLCQKRCGVDIGTTYYRQAAGPYDPKALRSIDSQMKNNQWYAAQKTERGYRYIPLAKAGSHKVYFDRHFADIEEEFTRVIEILRKATWEQCEIVATLFEAWDNLLSSGEQVTVDRIIYEVLHWGESKKRINEGRWRNAIDWMKKKDLVPRFNAAAKVEGLEFEADEYLEKIPEGYDDEVAEEVTDADD